MVRSTQFSSLGGLVSTFALLAGVTACSSSDSTPSAAGTGGAGGGAGTASGATGAGTGTGGTVNWPPFENLCPSATAAPNYGKPLEQLPAAPSAMTTAGLAAFTVYGSTAAPITVTGQSFTAATRITSVGPYLNYWASQFGTNKIAAIAKDDVLLATFWARCEKSLLESAQCRASFVLEGGAPDYAKSVNMPITPGIEWRQYTIPIKALSDFAAGAPTVGFQIGYDNQTLDLADFTLTNYAKTVPLADLPRTKIAYQGEEANAPWRAEAAARIEALRKGELSVSVTRGGKAVTGAKVTAKLVRNEFGFGSAIVASRVTTSTAADDLTYKSWIPKLFNTVVEENALKWAATEWGAGFGLVAGKASIQWAKAQGLRTKGHVLVWPSWRNSPKSIKTAYDANPDVTVLRDAIRKHVTEYATAMSGLLDMWDVVNEPFDNQDLTDIVGEPEMIEWFKLARAADSKAQLFINDYAILAGGGGDTAHRKHYEATIKKLIDGGAPLGGIGVQGHFGTALTGMTDAKLILDRFGAFKKPLWVTEYDIVLDDEDLAARYTRDIMTLFFSHASSAGFMMWGFWDGAHWYKDAPLFENSFCLKASGAAYRQLVERDWVTNASLVTDAKGAASLRGFRGTYEVTVEEGGKKKTSTVQLGASATAKVALD